MLVKLDFYLDYFIYGLFVLWVYYYLTIDEPEIYEYEKKENFICAI
jgi:hypothetical protein